MTKREKIRGLFLGVMVGDCLGMPVETWEPDRIAKTYGRVDKMLVPDGHKWFNGELAGSYTDDTQLTLAVAQAIVDAGGLDMDAQARRHVEAFKETTKGWGNSTRESVRALANGSHWSASARGHGQGNGVPMKIAPVGAFASMGESHYGEAVNFTMELSQMTHATIVSASAALAQMAAVSYCLSHDPDNFNIEHFVFEISSAAAIAEIMPGPEMTDEQNIPQLLQRLNEHEDYYRDRIIAEFGGGHCPCFHSIPFAHMFFVKGYEGMENMGIDSMYEVVNAGGDTDSNASMLGALLGALHGPSVFPNHLVDGLLTKQKVVVDGVTQDFIQSLGL